MDARALRRAFYALGDDAVDRALMDAPACHAAAKSWRRPVLPVTGDDLLARGWKPGAELGRTLQKIELSWIASDFASSKESLLDGLAPPPDL
jgi:hypothetical protein